MKGTEKFQVCSNGLVMEECKACCDGGGMEVDNVCCIGKVMVLLQNSTFLQNSVQLCLVCAQVL
jgi:hypothetical protein